MDIRRKKIKIRELCEGFRESGAEGVDGVRGYGGKLDIRPPYQREFVYDDKKRDAVIRSVMRGFPLNVMYWVEHEADAYEMLDGQQRTISICRYVDRQFEIKDLDGNSMYFSSLPESEKKKILDYELLIYVCRGEHKEKLEWFEIVNIAGEKLYPQEMRNAIYNGPWVFDAKKRFSRIGCPGQRLGSPYIKGNIKRQELLETAIKWSCGSNGDIGEFMSRHQHQSSAEELWNHFEKVILWVKKIFPEYRKIMKGVEWGRLHDSHKNEELSSGQFGERVATLLKDSDVSNQKGIYEYLLTGDEKHLNIRAFDNNTKLRVYEKQGRKCAACQKPYEFDDMEGDHIIPWSQGGHTTEDNLQMLCRPCHRRMHVRR